MADKTQIQFIVGITGASGAVYAIKLLEILKNIDVQTHLIISKSAKITINAETDKTISQVENMAHFVYKSTDIGARIASGSFRVHGMMVVPCSMKTLSSIANGYEDNLITRAASVVIKERKLLTLMIRETPLHSIHIENMLKLSRVGVVINPAVPAFYNNPQTIDDLITHSITRMLDIYGIELDLISRWSGLKSRD